MGLFRSKEGNKQIIKAKAKCDRSFAIYDEKFKEFDLEYVSFKAEIEQGNFPLTGKDLEELLDLCASVMADHEMIKKQISNITSRFQSYSCDDEIRCTPENFMDGLQDSLRYCEENLAVSKRKYLSKIEKKDKNVEDYKRSFEINKKLVDDINLEIEKFETQGASSFYEDVAELITPAQTKLEQAHGLIVFYKQDEDKNFDDIKTRWKQAHGLEIKGTEEFIS